jgi:DNA-binding beta-propeller fold protein YncE
VVFDSDGSVILFPGDRAIVRRDLVTGDRTIVSSGTTGSGPAFTFGLAMVALAPQAAAVYAFDSEVQTLYSIDPANGNRVPVPEPTGAGPPFGNKAALALDPAGKRLLVLDEVDRAGHLLAVDLQSGDRSLLSGTDTVGGRSVGAGRLLNYPTHLAYDAAANRVLVVDRSITHDQPSLLSIDLASGNRTVVSDALRGTGPLLAYPDRVVLDQSRNRAYVIDPPRAILAIDLTTGNRIPVFGTGAGSGPVIEYPAALVLDPGLDRAYVAGEMPSGGLYRIDLATGARSLISGNDVTLGLGPQINFPQDVALDLPRNRVLVTESSINAVVAVDLSSGRRTILADAATGVGPALHYPMSIALDPGRERAFVVDRNGVIVIELSSGRRAIVSK